MVLFTHNTGEYLIHKRNPRIRLHKVFRVTGGQEVNDAYAYESFPPPCQSKLLSPPSTQAFHEGMARVAARISAITSTFSGGTPCLLDAAPPVFVVAGGNWGGILLSAGSGGPSRLKERETGSYTSSNSIQSCQGLSLGTTGSMGAKGLYPRTRSSWMMNSDGSGT